MKAGAEHTAWVTKWLIAGTGKSSMSQRKVTSIQRCGGGLSLAKRLAKKHQVHLLRLTDDEGNDVVAASKSPFQVLCWRFDFGHDLVPFINVIRFSAARQTRPQILLRTCHRRTLHQPALQHPQIVQSAAPAWR